MFIPKTAVWLVILICFCGLLFTSALPAKATVMVGDVAASGRVYINYFSNHDYISRDLPELYEFSVHTLSPVREKLVNQGKIDKKPVLIEIPSSVFELKSAKSYIENRANCSVSYGETVTEPLSLGDCYYVYLVNGTDYHTLLLSVISLQLLDQDHHNFQIGNMADFARQNNLSEQEYSGEIYYSDPFWSPDSRYAAFGKFTDGSISFDVYDTDNDSYLQTPALDRMIVSSPVWSADGRYLAYASLSQVIIFDSLTGNHISIDVSALSSGHNFETLVSYDSGSGRFYFAFDTNLLSGYDIYAYNLDQKKSSLIASDLGTVHWDSRDLISPSAMATSPDGSWEARVDNFADPPVVTVNKVADRITETGGGQSPAPQSVNSPYTILVVAVAFVVGLAAGFMVSLKRPKKDGIGTDYKKPWYTHK